MVAAWTADLRRNVKPTPTACHRCGQLGAERAREAQLAISPKPAEKYGSARAGSVQNSRT